MSLAFFIKTYLIVFLSFSHDILVFLTGQDEIEQMATQIRTVAKSPEIKGPTIRVHPLYAALPQQKQNEVFGPAAPNTRKIILATNIAETSVTINGIKYVIDTGVVKMRNHDSVTGMDTLKVTKISQAQAIQRAGRAGRESDGFCYRTYTQHDYNQLNSTTPPEILRCNLSSAILQLMSMDLDLSKFEFMDMPDEKAINSGMKELKLLGACRVFSMPLITEVGRRMAKFPLDPKFSKIIMSAPSFDCVDEILDLVSILSVENIFVETIDRKDQALAAHSKFHSKYGDHLTLLNVFKAFKKVDRVKVCLLA